MKDLTVRQLVARNLQAGNIPDLFRENGLEYNAVSCVNWPESFPYAPSVEFALACTSEAFLIHFRVSEEGTRALAVSDHGRVWEDACVEFFLIPAGDGCYYNIECNCIGTLHIAAGAERKGRVPAPTEIMQGVKRWTTLPCLPFEDRPEPLSWEVAMVIPLSTFFMHKLSVVPSEFTANFYKCGGTGLREHYLSWAPIDTASPDFHRPEFFGKVCVKQ